MTLLAQGANETVPIVDGHEERGEDEGDNGLELHDNVEGWARGVLEGVAYGISLHGGVVRVPSLRGRLLLRFRPRVLGVAQLDVC